MKLKSIKDFRKALQTGHLKAARAFLDNPSMVLSEEAFYNLELALLRAYCKKKKWVLAKKLAESERPDTQTVKMILLILKIAKNPNEFVWYKSIEIA